MAVTSVTPADGPSHPGQRRLGRLAHDLAQLAGEAQAHALAPGHDGGLDEEDVAAVVGVGETHDHAGLRGALRGLRQVRRGAEALLGERRVDRHGLGRGGSIAGL